MGHRPSIGGIAWRNDEDFQEDSSSFDLSPSAAHSSAEGSFLPKTGVTVSDSQSLHHESSGCWQCRRHALNDDAIR